VITRHKQNCSELAAKFKYLGATVGLPVSVYGAVVSQLKLLPRHPEGEPITNCAVNFVPSSPHSFTNTQFNEKDLSTQYIVKEN
jgi:hypothetical protein